MIVKYARERGYQGKHMDPRITIDNFYIVFGLWFQSENRPKMVLIVSEDDKTPALFELQFFDIIDARIPEEWCFKEASYGSHWLDPHEFSGDFWDRFHDGDEQAESIFEEVRKKLEMFHGS